MKQILIFLCLVCLAGCKPKQPVSSNGPLSGMHEFQVTTYADTDQNTVFDRTVNILKQYGTVKILAAEEAFKSEDSSPGMAISVFGNDADFPSSIRIFGEVAIQPNQYKITSEIWSVSQPRESSYYPEEEGGKIIFKRNEESKTNGGLDELIAQFVKQYRDDNSENAQPVFYVFKSLFRS